MLTSDQILKKLEENKEKIKSFGVKRLALFGSYLRNEQKEESDIDFLVEFEQDKKTFDNYFGLKFFLEDLFNCKVDLVIKETIKEEISTLSLKTARYLEF